MTLIISMVLILVIIIDIAFGHWLIIFLATSLYKKKAGELSLWLLEGKIITGIVDKSVGEKWAKAL